MKPTHPPKVRSIWALLSYYFKRHHWLCCNSTTEINHPSFNGDLHTVIMIILLGKGIVFMPSMFPLMCEDPFWLHTCGMISEVASKHWYSFRFCCLSCLKSVLFGRVCLSVFKEALIKASSDFWGAQKHTEEWEVILYTEDLIIALVTGSQLLFLWLMSGFCMYEVQALVEEQLTLTKHTYTLHCLQGLSAKHTIILPFRK